MKSMVPRAGFESAIRPTLLVGVVNPVFSFTLGYPKSGALPG